MMLTTATAAADEGRDDVGPDGTDLTHEVADDLVVTPFVDRLLDAERVSEIHGPREILLGAVEPVDGQELLGAQTTNEDAAKIFSTGNGNAAGMNKITGDVAAMAAQIPALFETLSGMQFSDLLSKVKMIGDKTHKPDEKA